MAIDTFRTPVKIQGQTLITTDKGLVSLGSCFADIIGGKLKNSGFKISVNPFGTLFHPYSIFESLDPKAGLDERFFLETGDRVQHFRLPKTFFAKNRAAFEDEWKMHHATLHENLQKNPVLLLTLGTAFAYERDGHWVSNCHQRPAAEFRKKLSSLEEMKASWENVFQKLPKDLTVILSLSPVRHLKDGLVENNLSKSLLRVLIEEMRSSDPSRIHYFPAYEILMDELRDYRFYGRDMLHPSELASDYIWDIFQENYLAESAKQRVKTWEKLEARQKHRPLHPESEDFKAFQADLARDLKAFWES